MSPSRPPPLRRTPRRGFVLAEEVGMALHCGHVSTKNVLALPRVALSSAAHPDTRALMNARPSHLLDPKLFDFEGLSRKTEAFEEKPSEIPDLG